MAQPMAAAVAMSTCSCAVCLSQCMSLGLVSGAEARLLLCSQKAALFCGLTIKVLAGHRVQ